MSKQVSCLCLLLALSNPAWAYKIGIGIDEKQTILIPIRLTDGFMMEFFFEQENIDEEYNQTIVTKNYFDFGIGLLGFIKPQETIEYYYGIRISKPSYKQEKSIESYSEKSTFKGIILNPTIGAQYNFNKYLSLGLEAGYHYRAGQIENSKINYSTNTISHSSYTDLSGNGIKTRVLARVMF